MNAAEKNTKRILNLHTHTWQHCSTRMEHRFRSDSLCALILSLKKTVSEKLENMKCTKTVVITCFFRRKDESISKPFLRVPRWFLRHVVDRSRVSQTWQLRPKKTRQWSGYLRPKTRIWAKSHCLSKMPWAKGSFNGAEIYLTKRCYQDLFVEKISDLRRLPIGRYELRKLIKIVLFVLSDELLKKWRVLAFGLKLFFYAELIDIRMLRKFQLKPENCSSRIGCSKSLLRKTQFYGALSKNAIKIERCNIFWIGLRQQSLNTCLYHVYQNELDRRSSFERWYRESVVAYVEWLIRTNFQICSFPWNGTLRNENSGTPTNYEDTIDQNNGLNASFLKLWTS